MIPTDTAKMDLLSALLQRLWRFVRLTLYHFSQDGGSQNAAALTYTTLLSLVPLMTVIFALISVFPISGAITTQINDFIFNNFVPAAGEVVQDHLQTFSGKAGRLSGVGFFFLLIISLLLLAKIESAFNTIWHSSRKRKLLNTFIVYWAILSLGPVLIIGSLAATSYLVTLPFISDAVESFGFVRRGLLALMPIVVATIAFTLLYSVLPNQRVALKHALIGGLFAALLFEAAKRGFALYLTHFQTYEAIYGALAAIPIFLVWIYLCWLVTLLGAEVTYCLGIYRDDWEPGEGRLADQLVLAYRLLRRLWQAQLRGQALSSSELVAAEPLAVAEQVDTLMLQLQEGQLVLRTEERRWVLSRDLDEVTLSDLYRSGGFFLPLTAAEDEALNTILAHADRSLSELLAVPLAQLYRTDLAEPD